jgi:hypothetical protein
MDYMRKGEARNDGTRYDVRYLVNRKRRAA